MIEINSEITKVLQARADATKSNARVKKLKNQGIDTPSEMCIDVVRNMYRMSRGHCAATGVKFVCESHHPKMFSLDRINPNKGYTIDNVWLVTDSYNKGKSRQTVEEYDLLIQEMANEYSYC